MPICWLALVSTARNYVRTTLSDERGREMSNGIFSKIAGRALSIFGVSDPEDIRRMQARKISVAKSEAAKQELPQPATDDTPSQEKRTKDE